MLKLNPYKKRRVLIIDENINSAETACGRAITNLIQSLYDINLQVITSENSHDALNTLNSDTAICCIFVSWLQSIDNCDVSQHAMLQLLHKVRAMNRKVPILLMARHREEMLHLDLDAMTLANELVWILEDTAEFIAGRAESLIKHYLANLLPPFTKALLDYTTQTPEYSWAAPGHQGGVAFTKTAVGREFIDFFGENLFRTDCGIERSKMGSLLDHTGPVKASEKYAAGIFGADVSYSVLNGTSGSNRIIMTALIGERDIAVCDRNCHKSIEQGLILTGGIPVYLTPTRNRYGIIGPIPRAEMTAQAIAKKISTHPLVSQAKNLTPVYAVMTNCTYDGICYDAIAVQQLLAQSVDYIHFDEAWFAYARFNPIYQGHFAMRGDPASHDRSGPTVFATHSTHKLLASLSQAAYIHIRQGKKKITHSRFNESYMLQATTSPLYAIIAANEVGAAMMEGEQGYLLTQEVINEAVDFRVSLAKAKRHFEQRGEWFFEPWNAPSITLPDSGEKIAFAEAPKELLTTDPACWKMNPNESWHGFETIDAEWCMLDPIKVGIISPGLAESGELLESGIPAAILTSYLGQYGIIPSRTTDFMVLCLFSLGVTKGKWGTLINVLLSFKKDYDSNTPLQECLPELIQYAPQRYMKLGLKDLSNEMFDYMKSSKIDAYQAAAVESLPAIKVTPRHAFQQLMSGECELVGLDALTQRISAVGVIPYPPGIPIIMPGESFGEQHEPWLSYIRALQHWQDYFPGFQRVLEGTEFINNEYHIWCLKKDTKE